MFETFAHAGAIPAAWTRRRRARDAPVADSALMYGARLLIRDLLEENDRLRNDAAQIHDLLEENDELRGEVARLRTEISTGGWRDGDHRRSRHRAGLGAELSADRRPGRGRPSV